MESINFRALVVRENQPNVFTRAIEERSTGELPQGDVLIEVHYSSLNYKDALSARGHKGITRRYPHTPGIDASGVVADSTDGRFKAGDEVIVTGYDLGMNTSGGFGRFVRVPGDWIVPLPANLSLRDAMSYGTAGFTAAMAIHEIMIAGITPSKGMVLVTGASGGVGSIAVAMLSKLGYEVTASSGKPEYYETLRRLGAGEIISRDAARDTSAMPLLPKRWAAVIDNVGGTTLATAIRSAGHHAVVCTIGLVESEKLDLTIFPFITRGVKLAGIDSAGTSMDKRSAIWELIAHDYRAELDAATTEVALDGLEPHIEAMLGGRHSGHVIVRLA